MDTSMEVAAAAPVYSPSARSSSEAAAQPQLPRAVLLQLQMAAMTTRELQAEAGRRGLDHRHCLEKTELLLKNQSKLVGTLTAEIETLKASAAEKDAELQSLRDERDATDALIEHFHLAREGDRAGEDYAQAPAAFF